jgi:hypothetical protein
MTLSASRLYSIDNGMTNEYETVGLSCGISQIVVMAELIHARKQNNIVSSVKEGVGS